jgi:hypothetical protein
MTNHTNLFWSDKEKKFFESINKELLGHVIRQEIIYYAVSVQETQANFYGESESKTYRLPIKMWALVQYEKPITSYETMQVDKERKITVKFLRKYLEEQNTMPREGDFVQFGDILYEVITLIEPKLVTGQPSVQWDFVANCMASRKNVSDLNLITKDQ